MTESLAHYTDTSLPIGKHTPNIPGKVLSLTDEHGDTNVDLALDLASERFLRALKERNRHRIACEVRTLLQLPPPATPVASDHDGLSWLHRLMFEACFCRWRTCSPVPDSKRPGV